MAATHHFEASRLFDMQGYVCVVTGGGSGIGLMASQAMAANGAKVYITGRRPEALQRAAESHTPAHGGGGGGGSIIPLGPCDVRSKDELQRLVDEVAAREAFIHLLFCNAGVAGPKAAPEHADADALKARLWDGETVEAWQATFETDVTAVYFTTVAFLPLLQAGLRPHGPLERWAPSVITTSSMSGLMRHAQGHFAYNAAKAATVHLSRLMSAEFQRTGVRVNSVAPGYFPSEMTAEGGRSDAGQKSELPDDKVRDKGHVPAMRAGRDEEIGMTILYLAKNAYVNGQIVAVDGGVLNVVGGA